MRLTIYFTLQVLLVMKLQQRRLHQFGNSLLSAESGQILDLTLTTCSTGTKLSPPAPSSPDRKVARLRMLILHEESEKNLTLRMASEGESIS